MAQRAMWLIVVVIAAVTTWLLVRTGGDPMRIETATPEPVTIARNDAVPDSASTAAAAVRASKAEGVPPATNTVATGEAPARASDAQTVARAPVGAPAREAAPPAPPPALPHTPPDGAGGSGDKFTDRTGWSDNSVAKQLNKEFMPLASECIEQAQNRNRQLEGLLAFTMVIAPTESGRAVVSSLKIRTDNQINDPELFECIRESSFSLDGLKAPHDFDITMPIHPEGSAT